MREHLLLVAGRSWRVNVKKGEKKSKNPAYHRQNITHLQLILKITKKLQHTIAIRSFSQADLSVRLGE